jgi:hypothetical protein
MSPLYILERQQGIIESRTRLAGSTLLEYIGTSGPIRFGYSVFRFVKFQSG